MKSSSRSPLRATSLLRALLACGIAASPLSAWSFSEDINLNNSSRRSTSVATDKHSTFHYEMTRTLTRAAGFSSAEAEQVAKSSSATDSFPNDEVTTCPAAAVSAAGKMVITGTTRNIPVMSPYFHWPRRGSDNVTNGLPYPGGVNTCSFFDGTADACPADVPELNELEGWALLGNNWAPSGAAADLSIPCVSENGSSYQTIQPASLLALGVYLHSLADSYSHQDCMQADKVRTHDSAVSAACQALDWHLSQEYGSATDGAADLGFHSTLEGAQAVWDALKRYRALNALPEQPEWAEEEALDFMNAWAGMEDAEARSDYANAVYDELNQTTTTTTRRR